MWGWVIRCMLAACVLLGAAMAHAEAIPASRPLTACVLRATPGDDPATLIRHPERFDCAARQTALGPGDYWVISDPIGIRSRSRDLQSAQIASLWQRAVRLHVLYADGHMAVSGGDGTQTSRYLQLGALIEHPIPRSAAPVARLLWQVDGSANMRGILLGAKLVNAAATTRSNISLGAMYALFGGICLALLVYDLSLWAALRHRFQLAHAAVMVTLGAYIFSSSGALAWVWPDIPNNDRLRINYLVLALCLAATQLFVRTFFEERVYAGWYGRMADLMAGVTAVNGVLIFLLAPYDIRLMDRIYLLTFMAVAPVILIITWRAWAARSNYLWFYALVWALPIVTSLLRLAANLNFLPWSFWMDNSTVLSLGCEALLSSIAMAYRIHLLGRERDEARAREIIARGLADTDPLTGLLNRRAFLDRAIGRPGAQMLLIVDLDHFKHINETLGHDGGDEVLRVVARVLRACTPASALVARLGGEEFAILADAVDPVLPRIVLDKLRAAPMPFDLNVTASIGACTGPLASEMHWKHLYRGADTALFEAKSAGRDRARSTVSGAYAA